tara:strand:+ start:267 stop:1385 length:1119 start_codon:yes stop_codon:yes gene_type:complete
MDDSLTSVINPELNYDFLFQDSLLDPRDKGVYSSIHKINIFGKNYSIAMGTMKQHPDTSSLNFFITYLVFKSKVICKLGVYEYNAAENTNHEEIDFSKMKMLLHTKFYTSPDDLVPFQRDKDSFDNNEEEKINEEVEEGEEEEEIDGLLYLKQEMEQKIKELASDKKNSFIRSVFNIMDKLSNTTIAQSSPQKKQFSDVRVELRMKSKHNLFKEGVDSKNNRTAYLNLEYFDTPDLMLNRTLLHVIEYVLNTKVLIVDGQNNIVQFSTLEQLEKEKVQDKKVITSKLTSMNLYKHYDPDTILLVKKIGDEGYEIIQKKQSFDSLSKQQQEQLKKLYEESPHEYFEPNVAKQMNVNQFKVMRTLLYQDSPEDR